MRLLTLALFWGSAVGVAATYVLYPLTLRLLLLFRGRARHGDGAFGPTPGDEPELTIVVVAHDEERVIARRLENLGALDYPLARRKILVVSDGSRDGTVAAARAAAPPDTEILDRPVRKGKTRALIEALEHIEGEVVVFTDADSWFEPDAVRWLVARFREPDVGCVVGRLSYVNTDHPRVGRGEGLYWRYENAVKEWESRLGSTIVANGSIYAVRRALVRPVAPQVDFDTMLPLQVIADGWRVVFEPRARAAERAAETLGEEFRRKTRIINQQIWGLIEVRGLIGTNRVRAACSLFFHKVLRWSVPVLLGANAGAALVLRDAPVARLALAAHGAVALAAGLGWWLDRSGRRAGWLWTATYFWAVNLAALVAFVACLRGRRVFAWDKAASTR